MILILAEEDDYLVHCVENEFIDFYRTEDIRDFISKTADICFIDFGSICSVYDLGDFTWALRLLVKYIEENSSTLFYFCLMMPTDFYNEYKDVWELPNVIKVPYVEWVKGNAIERILSGTYKIKTDLLFNDLPMQLASSHKCKDCKHIQKWQCGGSFFFYCGVTKDRKTHNGLKKVKCKTLSCGLFEKREDASK